MSYDGTTMQIFNIITIGKGKTNQMKQTLEDWEQLGI